MPGSQGFVELRPSRKAKAKRKSLCRFVIVVIRYAAKDTFGGQDFFGGSFWCLWDAVVAQWVGTTNVQVGIRQCDKQRPTVLGLHSPGRYTG